MNPCDFGWACSQMKVNDCSFTLLCGREQPRPLFGEKCRARRRAARGWRVRLTFSTQSHNLRRLRGILRERVAHRRRYIRQLSGEKKEEKKKKESAMWMLLGNMIGNWRILSISSNNSTHGSSKHRICHHIKLGHIHWRLPSFHSFS